MTWTERALLITAVSAAVANTAMTLWTLLRACQTYNLLKDKKTSAAQPPTCDE